MQLREEVTASVRAEVMKVLSHPLAPRMRALAEHLAFETDLSADAAIGCMKAFAQDLDDAAKAGGSAGSFIARKTAAGTLGLGSAEPAADPQAVADGWAKAAAEANAKRGATH